MPNIAFYCAVKNSKAQGPTGPQRVLLWYLAPHTWCWPQIFYVLSVEVRWNLHGWDFVMFLKPFPVFAVWQDVFFFWKMEAPPHNIFSRPTGTTASILVSKCCLGLQIPQVSMWLSIYRRFWPNKSGNKSNLGIWFLCYGWSKVL